MQYEPVKCCHADTNTCSECVKDVFCILVSLAPPAHASVLSYLQTHRTSSSCITDLSDLLPINFWFENRHTAFVSV